MVFDEAKHLDDDIKIVVVEMLQIEHFELDDIEQVEVEVLLRRLDDEDDGIDEVEVLLMVLEVEVDMYIHNPQKPVLHLLMIKILIIILRKLQQNDDEKRLNQLIDEQKLDIREIDMQK